VYLTNAGITLYSQIFRIKVLLHKITYMYSSVLVPDFCLTSQFASLLLVHLQQTQFLIGLECYQLMLERVKPLAGDFNVSSSQSVILLGQNSYKEQD
jgi:hypothetical protein